MAQLDSLEIRRIAVECDVDPRSVSAEIAGRRVRGIAGDKIRRALVARGLPITTSRGQPPVIAGAAAAMRGGGESAIRAANLRHGVDDMTTHLDSGTPARRSPASVSRARLASSSCHPHPPTKDQ